MAEWLRSGPLADVTACLGFFSRLPVRFPQTPRPLAEVLGVLPVAGLAIGLCGALPLWLGAVARLPGPAAALLGVAGTVLATGGLHEDGLADAADGFGGGRTPERKLAIMRDSRIGTYGVLALVLALGWRVAALAAFADRLPASAAATLLAAAAAVSRAGCLVPLALLRPARPDGLGHGAGRPGGRTLATAGILALVIGLGLPGLATGAIGGAALGCALAAAAAAGVTALAARQIGGQTGDIAGACQQGAEAAYLLGLLLVSGASAR